MTTIEVPVSDTEKESLTIEANRRNITTGALLALFAEDGIAATLRKDRLSKLERLVNEMHDTADLRVLSAMALKRAESFMARPAVAK